MKISSLYSPFVLLSLFCQSIASPAHIKRDAKGNVVTIRLKKTIQQTQTNYYTVDSPTATYTNTVVNTNTKTVTRYTATVTSTVLVFLILILLLLLLLFLPLMLFQIVKMK